MCFNHENSTNHSGVSEAWEFESLTDPFNEIYHLIKFNNQRRERLSNYDKPVFDFSVLNQKKVA